MTIKYYQKAVYGNVKHYIIDPVTAEAWRRLTGDVTVMPDKAKALTDLLGGSVEWEQVTDPSVKPL
jgi:hypothetical protein